MSGRNSIHIPPPAEVGPTYNFNHDDKDLFMSLISLFHQVGSEIQHPNIDNSDQLKQAYEDVEDLCKEWV